MEGQASYHVRSDFPRRNPKSGRTMFVVSMEDGRLKVEERKALERPLQFLSHSARMLFLGPRFK
ncbi:MAG: hypothetical protein JJE48_02245 [Actinobacteria bacterium]|nr:hypothetical protein [Actinomycetota bacterium]